MCRASSPALDLSTAVFHYKGPYLYPGGDPLVMVPHRNEPTAGRTGHQNDPEQKEAHEGRYDGLGPARHYHRHAAASIRLGKLRSLTRQTILQLIACVWGFGFNYRAHEGHGSRSKNIAL